MPNTDNSPAPPPRVWVPLRTKITLPYVLLALALALAGGYVVNRVAVESIEQRFANQLIESGTVAADSMVAEENRLLATLRLLQHTEGMADSIKSNDVGQLQLLSLPIAVNYQEDAIEILDAQGQSLVSLRHHPGGSVADYAVSRGGAEFTGLTLAQNVLAGRADGTGDKYAEWVRLPAGDFLYIAGAVIDQGGKLAGVALVGRSLPSLTRQIRENTLAHVTLYDFDGQPIYSTFSSPESGFALTAAQALEIRQTPDHALVRAGLAAGSVTYTEIVGLWEVRGEGQGLMGVSLAQAFLVRPSQITRLQISLLVAAAFLIVITVGVFLAGQITRPLSRVMQASSEIARGNLEVQVSSPTGDEMSVLAHSFNVMAAGLREGSMYRDILGRAVSPEVREQLRDSFASGAVRLEGQEAVATVLMTDIRGFTPLSEAASPTTTLLWLNEYFGTWLPIIAAHGGVVHEFSGDGVLTFFGVLPTLLSPQESAYNACMAAAEMLPAVARVNERRAGRGEPLFVTGIGVNTGLVTSGGLGTPDRLHYAVLGDTVNTTQRLQNFTRQFGETAAAVSETTVEALAARGAEFRFESLGPQVFKGKTNQVVVYRLLGLNQT